ncbi:MAG TPA: hypothetical protein VHD60_02390 [Candidatus Saccharimonadales bacterium]|nr:hypothetical protein [Candidatus Saccharimonadales bacterium]
MSGEDAPQDRSDLPQDPNLFLHDSPEAVRARGATQDPTANPEEVPLAVYLLGRVTEKMSLDGDKLAHLSSNLHEYSSRDFVCAVKSVLREVAEANRPEDSTEPEATSMATDTPPKRAPYIVIPDEAYSTRFEHYRNEAEHNPDRRRRLQTGHAEALQQKSKLWPVFPEISLARALSTHLQSLKRRYPAAAMLMKDIIAVYDYCVTGILTASEHRRLQQQAAARAALRRPYK